jgi:hypothetical protein
MDYRQRNPVPIPASGAFESVETTIESVFDWQYALEQRGLLALYEKGKEANWNATDLDWTTEVDLEGMMNERVAAGVGEVFRRVLQPPRPLDDRRMIELRLNMNAFMLSQFLHGEQGALLATAKIVQTVPQEEAKFYAASQVMDEARHVEVYHRYLTEKMGISYPVVPSLQSLLNDIIHDSRWDVTFLGMQIMVEGLALAAFGMIRMMMSGEPLIQDIIGRIMADESRHVAFGVISLGDFYRNELDARELREREDFVIESSHLLRERLMMDPVFERLGFDVPLWTEWSNQTPFMKGFRQMTFSKIVPNLKRLGLLTPRVREAFAQMDLLRFEHMKDSIEEAAPQPPEELVKLLMEFLAQGAEAPAAETA